MEFVYVVPRQALFPTCYPHGFVSFDDRRAALVDRARFEASVSTDGFFVERAHAERTPAWKQVIPYTIVVCGEPVDERVLVTRRLARGGEARLHDKLSIGIGGHMNPIDADPSAKDAHRDAVDRCTRRELEEELVVNGEYKVRRVGILNDDSNPVGAVHVGVVQIARFRDAVEVRERDQLEGRLVTTEALRTLSREGANFETWSKLLIEHLDELIQSPLVVSA